MLGFRPPIVLAPLALAGIAACAGAPGATQQQLQSRAVFDLGCAQHQLVVYHVDQRTKAVAGCGRRLVYVESCQRIRGKDACTWMLDTPTFEQARWPDWQGHGGPPAHTLGQPATYGSSGRPVATQLFDPRQPAAAAPPAGTVVRPVPSASFAKKSSITVAPARGAPRRAHPTDLFDPAGQPGTSPATANPEGREIPTHLFDPSEL